MSTTLDDLILDRITFLQDQINPNNNQIENQTIQIQINVLQKAQLDRLDELIAIRRIDSKACTNLFTADHIFAELEALEWLQRQVAKQHV